MKPRVYFYAIVLAIVFMLGRLAGIPTGSPHRLSGHPRSLQAKLQLAKRQVQHDRRELSARTFGVWHVIDSHSLWLARDVAYVTLLQRAWQTTLMPAVDGCLNTLISRESGWDRHATNPTTGAYGLGQAFPFSKMPRAAWPEWAGGRSDAATQLRWTIGYAVGRYHSTCAALAFQISNGWY